MATVAPVLRLGPADHGRRLTLDEFLEAEEEPGFRDELAPGVLEVTEVPNDPHAEIVWFLLAAISDYSREHPGVLHHAGGAGEFRLWLPGMESGRNPDVAVVLQNAPMDYRNRRVPALTLEVVSEGDDAHEHDYVTKQTEYLAYGLFEYGIVDPIVRKITVLTRRGPVGHEQVFTGARVAEGQVLPGFTVSLADLWAAIDTQ